MHAKNKTGRHGFWVSMVRHTHLLKSFQPKWQCLEFHHPGMTGVLTPHLLEVTSTTQSQPMARKVRAVWLLLMSSER